MSKYIKSIKIVGIGIGMVACCAIFAEPVAGCFVDRLNGCNPIKKLIRASYDTSLSCTSTNYPAYSYAYAAPEGTSGYNEMTSVSQSCTWFCYAEDYDGTLRLISESASTPPPASIATGDECEVPWPPSL